MIIWILPITLSLMLLGMATWLMIRTRGGELKAYKAALELNQKRLDLQVSQINIFLKALPNLQSLLVSSNPSQIWRSLCLDEARAMTRSDEAWYWRYDEETLTVDLDLIRGPQGGTMEKKNVPLDEAGVGEAVRSKNTVLLSRTQEDESVLLVPLLVSAKVWGVCQFVKKGKDSLSQRDADLIQTFISQLSLTLENREMIENREKFYLELVQTLAETLDTKDASTEGQTRRARRLARGIARELEMPEEFITYLEYAALLHDIGKIAIDDQVLKKPGKLTPQEFDLIKKHPEIGHKILSPVTLLAPVAPMVLYHQEWFNGKGYPEGLSGEEIPLGARIVAILDAWNAMRSDHPWRKALSKEQAIEEIKKGAGTQFDPNVVDAFLAAIEKEDTLE